MKKKFVTAAKITLRITAWGIGTTIALMALYWED